MSSNIHLEKILNPEQDAAVHFGKGPLLIIAGSGTGKTTVVTERIKHLITSGLAKPQEILALTFTEKAAREMEERVDIAMPYGYTQMWISTFHSFCDRILKQEAIHIGLAPNYRLLSDTDITMLMRKHIFSMSLSYFRPLGNPTKFIGGILQHFSRLTDEDITPSQYADWVNLKRKALSAGDKDESLELEIKKWEELAHAYEYYESLKIKLGFMDFSNLIGNTLRLFRQRKNILKNYQNQFKFLLVDEFQDTNVAQNELILLLAGSDKNITVVADDDQSIYKFRGAAVSNVISFRKNFPNAKLIVLSRNYRSTQTILDHSYQLIQHNNPDRLEIKEGINKKLLATRNVIGENISFFQVNRVENEAEVVAGEIKKIIKLHKKNSWSWKDIAVLVRANNHAEAFVRTFVRLGIPFQFLGPRQLFQKPEIKELISYLQVLTNFEDNTAFFRVLTMDFFKFEARDLLAISNLSKRINLSLFEASELIVGLRNMENIKLPNITEETKQKLTNIISMIHRHMALLSKESAGQILFFFLEDTGILKHLMEYKIPIDEEKAQNMTNFFAKLKTYESEHEDISVPAMLDWIMLTMELGESPLAGDMDWFENDAVNILTVHSAKGLEFNAVFLVNLVTQRFPTNERKDQIPIPDDLIKEALSEGDFHEQEERRLFYVGMTRARDLLYLTAANYYGDGKRAKKISPFVYETLGENVIGKNITQIASQLSLLDWKKVDPPLLKTTQNKKTVTYLSYSQIQTFRMCPLHYKLRYISKIPTSPSSALSFGQSVHLALRDLYVLKNQKEKLDRNRILELLKKNWIREGYSEKLHEQEMYKRGEEYLLNFFETQFNPKIPTLMIEESFTIPLLNKERFLKIGGKIDRIDDLGNGQIEIVDYKTGKIPTQTELDTNLQLSMYAMAATEIPNPPFNRNIDNVILTLYYFDTQLKVQTKRTKKQLDEEKEKILVIAREIEESDFLCSDNKFCKTCEYRMFCGMHR